MKKHLSKRERKRTGLLYVEKPPKAKYLEKEGSKGHEYYKKQDKKRGDRKIKR